MHRNLSLFCTEKIEYSKKDNVLEIFRDSGKSWPEDVDCKMLANATPIWFWDEVIILPFNPFEYTASIPPDGRPPVFFANSWWWSFKIGQNSVYLSSVSQVSLKKEIEGFKTCPMISSEFCSIHLWRPFLWPFSFPSHDAYVSPELKSDEISCGPWRPWGHHAS